MINHDNYLAVKAYLLFKSEVHQRDPLTIKQMYAHLKLLLCWLDECPLAKSPAQRPVFPRWVAAQTLVHKPTVKVSPSWVKDVCDTTRAFFKWLQLQAPTTYPAISPLWIETLVPARLPELPPEERRVVTLEIVRALIAVKHEPNDLALWRDKAAAAFLFLSGMRAAAFVSLPLKCVSVAQREIRQFPTEGVQTKNRKAAITHLLNIPDLLEIVAGWDAYISTQVGPNDLWYAPLHWVHASNGLTTKQVVAQKAHEVSIGRAPALRRSLAVLFRLSGRPYMHPHLFRHGHALFGLKHILTLEEYKAVSMNLMHSSISITDAIYSVLPQDDVKAVIARLGQSNTNRSGPSREAIHQLAEMLLEQFEELQSRNGSATNGGEVLTND